MEAEVQVGKYTLESLTTGMYSDPMIVYREYIQNSVDSLENAVQQGIIDHSSMRSFVDTIKPNEEKCCCPHELSLTCLHESSSDCLTFCHQSLQGCRLTTGGNKDYVVMVPSISCSTTYLII